MVAGKNFGCGSSREHAPIAIKAAGISVVIADTFARIFYRNAINIGLPIIECPEAVAGIDAGDEVEVDFDSGIITNITQNKSFKGQPFPEFMQRIIKRSLAFVLAVMIMLRGRRIFIIMSGLMM